MKNKRMLQVMGQIDEKYIAEYLESNTSRRVITFPASRRLVLAAAIAGLMVLLMGCAWFALRLEDFQIGETIINQFVYDENGQEVGYQDISYNVLAASGMKNSPNFLAVAEWYAFIQEFDPDNAIQNAYYSSPDRPKYPEIYSAYWPYDQKMVDKLDELAEKYDLKLLGSVKQFQYESEYLDAIGLESVLRKDAPVKILFQNGHRYNGGNFGCVFDLEPLENQAEWPEFICGNLNYYRKDNLDTRFWMARSGQESVEWNYITSSGRELLVVSTPADYSTVIFCDRDDATLVLTLSTLRKPQGDVLSTALTLEQVEAILNSFDFDIQPK